MGGAPDHPEPGARNAAGDHRAVPGRRGWVLAAGDDQRRRCDRGQRGPQVHGGDRFAAARVAFGCDRLQRGHEAGRGGRVGPGERRGEPAADHLPGDGGHAAGPDRGRPLGPRRRLREVRGGAAHREGVDPAGGVRRQPHADHPAERDAAVRGVLDAEVVEHPQHVRAQIGEGVRAGRRGRAAVPAMLVTQQPEVLTQPGQLRLPQLPGGTQRVAEDQHRCLPRPVQRGRQPHRGRRGRHRR